MTEGVSIIIPTLNGGKKFERQLSMLGRQEYPGPIELLVVDSGSTDGTAERAEAAGAKVRRIAPEAFHHARTRNAALENATYERVLFLVQDAIPCSSRWLHTLAASLDQYAAVAAYAAQVPDEDADAFACFETDTHRVYLGSRPILQALEGASEFDRLPYDQAYRMIRMDNVSALYRKPNLEADPFPEVSFAEDMAWARKMVLKGHGILYQPEAQVRHSHNRSALYGFHRQVVNSRSCAQILGRVRDDYAFMSRRDLIRLTWALGACARQILAEEQDEADRIRRGRQHPVLRDILQELPVWGRLAAAAWRCMPSRTAPAGYAAVEDQCRESLRVYYMKIAADYQVTDPEHKEALLGKLLAMLLGRVYGETYASWMLSGALTPARNAFMRAFLENV